MASLSFTQFLSLPRCNADVPYLQTQDFVHLRGLKWNCKRGFKLTARRKISDSTPLEEEEGGNGLVGGKKSSRSSKRGNVRTKKKVATDDTLDGSSQLYASDEENDVSRSSKRGNVRKKKGASDDKLDESSQLYASDEESDVSRSSTRGSVRKKKVAMDDKSEESSQLYASDEENDVSRSSKRGSVRTKKKVATDEESSQLYYASDEESDVSRSSKRGNVRTKKKVVTDDKLDESSQLYVSDEESDVSSLKGKTSRASRRSRSKEAASIDVDDGKSEKKVRQKRRAKKENDIDDLRSSSDLDEPVSNENIDDENEDNIDIDKYDSEDISYTYGWPPLVCCFGSALHAFVPSGRRANRLLDYEIHDRMKDAFWVPEKFIRAPGGCAGSVAIALANLGGKVAFMGKLGDDEFGQAMLYYLNISKVQTRSVRIDGKRPTASSVMKLSKRGRLRTTCVKPCAEDSLSKSEINIDVLKEAKMFYFSTHSLLDKKMRSTTLQAIKISKKLGGVIFYDVNLPLPLWQSREETRAFIQEVWDLADIIEITKQELEFLCGIDPVEEFDTKNNDNSKFIHYESEIIEPLWHENLEVLFVTNGTSKVHYYTKEHNGAVIGMEDAPITPFTGDMSASGDGIVAGLMRMLTVQPDLITDKGYLERTVRYAIECGVVDQWLLAQTRGYPAKGEIEDDDDDDDDEDELDPNGIKSITEKEYRTVKYIDEADDPYAMKPIGERVYRTLEAVGSLSDDDIS